MTGHITTPLALPVGYAGARDEIHRVATHVLARARAQATGRIGLMATPGGIGTPAFGTDTTVVRIHAAGLVVDEGSDSTTTPFEGATLRSLAAAARADLDQDLSAGPDTPPLGDPDAPLALDGSAVAALGAWLALGWSAMDQVLAQQPTSLGRGADPRIQLWPEHFDAGTSVAVGDGPDDRANLGASAGDGFSPVPYLYVGPWGPDRPGDPSVWNAPFGAVAVHADIAGAADPLAAAVAFFRSTLAILGATGERG